MMSLLDYIPRPVLTAQPPNVRRRCDDPFDNQPVVSTTTDSRGIENVSAKSSDSRDVPAGPSYYQLSNTGT